MSGISQYYKTLELDNGASPEEVKQAYKDLALVWHPDRFPNNSRLQQKAQEKLKEINKAYEQLKLCQSNHRGRPYSPPKETQRPPHSRYKQAKSEPYSDHRQDASQQSRQSSKQEDFGYYKRGKYSPTISFQEAKAILTEYEFKLTRHCPDGCTCYKSGPFYLDIREDVPEVMLSVPCDSMGTFHRALLSIPCKSVATFHQSEAQDLINVFHLSASEG
ncbi:MAG: J domain-containing protein [Cyanobacteria bacterium QS_3_48_167]|nr:MAG: J domain-containing protein [Cyanobacteria bacterium QS_3_48_167]